MHFNLTTVVIAMALAASVYLLLNKSDRMFPTIAVVISGIWLMLVLGVMSLSLAKLKIDVILPAVLVVSGAICWARSAEKGTVTASSVLTLIGAIQLLSALRIL